MTPTAEPAPGSTPPATPEVVVPDPAEEPVKYRLHVMRQSRVQLVAEKNNLEKSIAVVDAEIARLEEKLAHG